MSLPLLSLLIFLPLLAAGVVWLLPAHLARQVSALSMVVSLTLGVAALVAYDPAGARFQLLGQGVWIASLNVFYRVGIDGIAVLFLPATALLFLGSLVACWNVVQEAPRLHYALLLLLEAATLGIFCALDTVLFFVFWEATLVPLYFLLGRWGVTAGAAAAATRYFLIMLAGGIPLLLAFVILAVSQAVPPFALTALLAVPLAPEAAMDLHWLLAGLGTVAIIYGAVGMLAQTNMRVSMAYASICHVGLAILGLASYTAQGAQGAVSLLLSFSVATGGAFLLLEFLRQRTGSNDIHALGGVAQSMPLLATGFLICGLAGVGMPGTSSFPGEFMLIIAALQTHTGAGMAALFGLSIAAGGFLALYRKAFFGPADKPRVAQASDLRPREWAVLIALIVMIVSIGIYPGPWIEIVRPAAEAWAAGLTR